MTEQAYEGYALLELMGHRRRVGFVREVEMYGGKLLRIDIPILKPDATQPLPDKVDDGTDPKEWMTEFYGTSSVYSLKPIAAEVAFEHARGAADPRPVRPMGFRPPEIEGPRNGGGEFPGDRYEEHL